MVATGVPAPSAKRPFDEFVASSVAALRREVRADARRRGLPTALDVDDVVQTAFAKLWPVYDRLENEFAAFNYAHKTALHAMSDARRHDRVRHERWLEAVHQRQSRASTDPEEQALRGLRVAAVRRALRRLPMSQRHAVTLVDLAELGQADAADVMGVSPTALKGLVQRGRARLRLDLREAPGLVALARLRRPLLAPLASAPALAVMAALCVTVLHTPVLPGTPVERDLDGAQRPATSAMATRPAADLAGPRLGGQAVQRRTAPAPKPAAPAAQPTATKTLPGGGACVGQTCTGSLLGDRVCVASGQGNPPVCANQSLVGVCPWVQGQPYVTCSRDSNPLVDPPLPPP